MPSLNPPRPAVGRVAVLNAVARSLPSLVARLHGTGVPVELCDGETDAEVLIVGGLDFGAAQFDAPPISPSWCAQESVSTASTWPPPSPVA